MTNLNKVVSALRTEQSRLERELDHVQKALNALGNGGGGSSIKRRKRFLSKDARRRIAAAQKLRWAKVRKAKAAKS
jgi:hypothetical protein